MVESATHSFQTRGFSLVELMVGIAIGLILVAGLATIFSQSSATHKELQQAAQQIENGRYAMELLTEDIKHAGFYGEYYNTGGAGGVLPDPCETASASNLLASLPFDIQGYTAPDYSTRADVSSTTCASYGLTSANMMPGSDVLVIRRAETVPLDTRTDLTVSSTVTPITNEVYIQENPTTAEIQFGKTANFAVGRLNSSNAVVTVGTRADGTATPVLRKANVAGASPVISTPRLAGEIRKFVVHVYFVAPCSLPNGGGSVCTGSSDDGGRPIPTLKRLELTSVGGVTTMQIVPLVEGIERLRVDYGLDNLPATVNSITGFSGDGAPDAETNIPGVADWPNVVTAELYILARNTEPTSGYTDNKTYTMGIAGTTAAPGDNYKRHLFSSVVRLINVSGRREIP